MADEGVIFDVASAKRIGDAVRRVEAMGGSGGGSSGTRAGQHRSATSFLARLTELQVGVSGKWNRYKWKAVSLKTNGDYEYVSGVTSGSDYTACAYSRLNIAQAGDNGNGEVVWLDYWGDDSDGKPMYRFEGGSNTVLVTVSDETTDGGSEGYAGDGALYVGNLRGITQSATDSVVVVNRRELYGDTHYLTESVGGTVETDGTPSVFDGIVVGWLSNGKPVVSIDGLKSYSCVDDLYPEEE